MYVLCTLYASDVEIQVVKVKAPRNHFQHRIVRYHCTGVKEATLNDVLSLERMGKLLLVPKDIFHCLSEAVTRVDITLIRSILQLNCTRQQYD